MAHNAARTPADKVLSIPATGRHSLTIVIVALAIVAFVTLLVTSSPIPTEATNTADIWRGNGATLNDANPAPGVVQFK